MPIIPLVAAIASLLVAAPASAPKAVSSGDRPADQRLGPLRSLDSYFPFKEVESPEQWEARRRQLRRQTKVATGLWPMPFRTPLNAKVHGKVVRDEYTVERVILESLPGHFVTGSLYRPLGRTGRRPAVLTPHGHWPQGRFYDAGSANVRRLIAAGDERFELGGRFPIQARCVQLARMGCVVFNYDMVGYADSVQLPHRGFDESDRVDTPEAWSFHTAQAELRLQNMMGLQSWNSIRALDFVSALPDVDPEKIAVTGASGGGTQTFMLGALDDRPAVLLPAVMVSTAMQGGCTCENACFLRVGAGNIDLAALAAPRPLGLTAANDWTVELETKGLPQLKALYEMLGHPKRVDARIATHFNHNYNAISRTFLYNWLNKHLGLGYVEPVLERDFIPLSIDEMTVWNDKHPKPSGSQVGTAHETAITGWFTKESDRALDQVAPNGPGSLDAFRQTVGGAFDVLLGRRLGDVGQTDYELVAKEDRGDYLLMTGLISMPAEKEQLPLLFLYPRENWNKEVVVWVQEQGKSELLDKKGDPTSEAKKLLDAGFAVISADLLFQGEFLEDGKPLERTRLGHQGNGRGDWQKAAAYTFGYNYSLFAKRVHDLLSIIKFIQTDQHGAERIHLLGVGKTAGPLVAAAKAQAGDAVDVTAIDTGGFRFSEVNRLDDPMFLPGAVKYRDLPGLLALIAPGKLLLAGETPDSTQLAKAAYRASGKPDRLRLVGKQAHATTALVDEIVNQAQRPSRDGDARSE
ncbi:hypothetical protein Pan216_30830 [Planctomycetes bacterium Pan216]|uniref:Uncharacterized protein n=1 Tax=Kolteria novifilia TaxID=2527975 RepID=A0A518B5H9_9BACT|nr:hypothetical protein Pan216_30830 [Planctomycetes bacterium Pan216]